MEAGLRALKGESILNLHVAVEEICLEILRNKVPTDTLIPKTKILLDMSHEKKEEDFKQLQSINLAVAIEAIKLHVAFRHIQFFARTTARVLSNLPRLERSATSAASTPSGSFVSLLAQNSNR